MFQCVKIVYNTYLHTYSMEQSPPEKLTSFQLVKKFPAFYGTWRFITTLASAHHLYQLNPVHPPHIPLPPFEWPSFTPIQNTSKIIVLYILIFKFLDSKLEDKRLHWMIASIPWLQSALNFFLNRLDLLTLFPNIWTVPPFQRNHCLVRTKVSV